MDKSRVKNFIILLLLTVNIVFLALWVIDSRESARLKSEMNENIRLMLNDCGVNVSDDVNLLCEPLSTRVYYRDLETEENNVDSILGKSTVDDRGGNIYAYAGETGYGVFRGGGDFELSFEAEGYRVSGSYVSACSAIIKKLGMTSDMDMDVRYLDDGSVVIDAVCKVEGANVYNCHVSFAFADNQLLSVSGIRVFDVSERGSNEKGKDSATAISYFAKSVFDGEIKVESLNGLQCGYIQTVTVSGECILTPTWKFSTDTGDYYINALTGRLQIF